MGGTQNGLPQYPGGSHGGVNQSQKSTDGGTFTGTVGTDKTEEFSFIYGEVQVCDTTVFAVAFRKTFCLDCFHGSSSVF